MASCSVHGCSGRLPSGRSRAGLRRLGLRWRWRWLPAGMAQKQTGTETDAKHMGPMTCCSSNHGR